MLLVVISSDFSLGPARVRLSSSNGQEWPPIPVPSREPAPLDSSRASQEKLEENLGILMALWQVWVHVCYPVESVCSLKTWRDLLWHASSVPHCVVDLGRSKPT